MEFGQLLVNNRSSLRKVRVTNNSDTNVTLTALSVEGTGAPQFTLANLPLPLVLRPGQEQEVGLYFTPQAEADVNCVLKITFSDLPLPLGGGAAWQGHPRGAVHRGPRRWTSAECALAGSGVSCRSPSPT